MAALDQILKYLDKPEVSEVNLQAGRAISAKVNGSSRPLSAAPLAASTLDMLLTHTELTLLRGTGKPERLRVNGITYMVSIGKTAQGATFVKLERAEKLPAPTPPPQRAATPPPEEPAVAPPDQYAAQAPLQRPAPRVIGRGGAVMPSAQPAMGRQGESTSPGEPMPYREPTNPSGQLPPGVKPLREHTRPPGGPMMPPERTPPPQRIAAGPADDPVLESLPDEPTPVPLPHDGAGAAQHSPIATPLPMAAPVVQVRAPIAPPPPPMAPPVAQVRAPIAPPPPMAPPVAQVRAPIAPPPPPEIVAAAAHATAAGLDQTPIPWGAHAFQPDIVPYLQQMLSEARARGASDIHVVAGRPARFRLVGQLLPQGGDLDQATCERLLMPLLDARSADQLQRLGYADFAFDAPSVGRIRANINQAKTGIKGCFRLVVANPPTLQELGLPDELAKVTTYHQGLAIVSGPSGHGKTTTMAALVDLINSSKPDHIITVEDPVEIVHPIKRAVMSQRQVGMHTNSFQAALKGALREDPDVIVIGELRDVETVAMALSAAETGHLVIATMSTPSGAKTIDRLIDMFPPEDQNQVRATLSGALKIVVSQRLLPSADGTRLVAAAELITGNLPLWNLIRDDKLFQLPSLLQRGRAFGMIRLEDSLRDLLASGTISMETATRIATDPRALQAPATAPPPGGRPMGSPPQAGRDGDEPTKPKRGFFGR